jgi:uncharacterized membrane protein YfcA
MQEFLTCVSLVLLAFGQNVAFSLVSRSRNRDSTSYHLVAATLSNVVWFLTFRELVISNMSWSLLAPYTIGTVSGSIFGVRIAMKIEKWLGATSDGHLKNGK